MTKIQYDNATELDYFHISSYYFFDEEVGYRVAEDAIRQEFEEQLQQFFADIDQMNSEWNDKQREYAEDQR